MKVSLNWLRDFVDIHLSAEEISEKLSLTGLEVEEIIYRGFDVDQVVIGEVLESNQHPNADRLKVCKVNTGTETLQIVCGAPNVAAGQKVPVALVGATLPNGMKIKKAKLRGVESVGMICAQDELGISDDHSGIWVLPEDAPIGTPLKEYLQDLKDVVFDLSITPNRPDCMSHLGVAREISAFTGEPLKEIEVFVEETDTPVEDIAKVTVHAIEGCPRYAARVIRNVKIGPSPKWLQNRLEAVGIRSINNVVDVTNYVLMELGHPLHAFDYERLAGHEIQVRLSKEGEKFVTLDGKEHTLPSDVVLICDAEKAVAIGGIMGGENSEVTNDTVNILLESAYFNPVYINRAAKKLGISTDASQRFERGADPNGVIRALDRAAQLIREVAGGEIARGIIDVYPKPIKEKEVPLRLDMINKIIGVEFTAEQMTDLLAPIGIQVKGKKCIVPTFRPDIERVADIAEEVARLYGFDKIPAREITEIPYGVKENEYDDFIDDVKLYFAYIGFYESITNTMVKKEFEESIIGEELLPILNPISNDFSAVRRYLAPSMLQVIKNNINRQNYDLRLFEINRIFHPIRKGATLPEEELHICIAMTGYRYPVHWGSSGEKVDFYDLKGVIESFLRKNSLDNFTFISYDNFVSSNENLALKINDEIAGFIAKVDERVLDKFDIEQDVYLAELNLGKIYEHRQIERKYREISRFPRTERDMAFVVDKTQPAEEMIAFIRKEGGKYLKEVIIFDRYVGKSLDRSKQSLAFRLVFQAEDRTLTDDEVNSKFQAIIKKFEKRFHAQLRQ